MRAAPPPREPWTRSSARELVRRAAEYRKRGEGALALAEYNEALRLDPSYADAYLGLASTREAMGDLGEAERVYDLAARSSEGRADALTGRARVRRALGRDADAIRDLEAAVALAPDPARLKLLASWYVERRTWPAALVAWRRVQALLEAENGPEHDEARVRVQALTLLASDSDPVALGADGDAGWVRRALATIARRTK